MLDPTTSSYAGVVSRESIRISLTYSALMELPVIGADIQNAYLQAPSSEKHFIICGPEFRIENEGRVALIRRALYGGKVAGRDFWHHLCDCMHRLGFTSSCADPDVWFRLSKWKTGEEYYKYVLLYVDDVLVISENAEKVLAMGPEAGIHWTSIKIFRGTPTAGNSIQWDESMGIWLKPVCQLSSDQRAHSPAEERGQTSVQSADTHIEWLSAGN